MRAPQANALTALVVDDHRDAADSLAEFLRELGMATGAAYSGAEALALLPALRPDRAVLDIGMPGTDGYGLARRLRQQPEGRRTLPVALTGWGRQHDREATTAAGFQHRLAQPLDPEQLRAILDGLNRC